MTQELFPKQDGEDPKQEEEELALQAKNPGFYQPFTEAEIKETTQLGALIMRTMNARQITRSHMYNSLGVPRGYFDVIVKPQKNSKIRLAIILKVAAILDIPLVRVLQ